MTLSNQEITEILGDFLIYCMYNYNITELEASIGMLRDLHNMGYAIGLQRVDDETVKIVLGRPDHDED